MGVCRAAMRTTRGLRYSVMRLIVPPLPAASRPSKITATSQAGVLDPLLELDELDLQLDDLGLVGLAVELLRA